MQRFGLPEAVLAAPFAELVNIAGARAAAALRDFEVGPALAANWAWLAQPRRHLVALGSPDYPPALLDTPDPPTLLWMLGDPACLARPGLAIVGARSATRQGLDNAEAFARHLAERGFAIVSGLAEGIDTAAHRGALAGGGATVAVIGTGADRIYPASNRELAYRIAEQQGVLISEFPLGTPASPGNFPRRNRLIAGLSRGVLVVEAALRSGSLITARLAVEQGREVFAIPGSIHSPLSRGCHQLIRQGARLVESAQDIFEEIGKPPDNDLVMDRSVVRDMPDAHATGNPAIKKVLDILGYEPFDMDKLVARSGLTVDALYAILLEMELENVVERLPGGRFQRRQD